MADETTQHPASGPQARVAVVMTVLNDVAGCTSVLKTLAAQTRAPDEVLFVDGGSTDGTRALLEQAARADSRIRVIDAPGCNIAQGRNIAIEKSTCPVIATTDAGCRLASDWLEHLVRPFDEQPPVDVVAGFYRIDPRSRLEAVVGRVTMPGQLDPVVPERFNPSARSMAFTKAIWRRADGFPDWLYTSEDTLFDIKLRGLAARWTFAGEAVVHWRPRSTCRAIAKQFYLYGRGRGQTQIGARDHWYNLRNLALLILVIAAGFAWAPIWWAVPAVFGYFFVWAFHAKALRVARDVGELRAYPIALGVCWLVLLAGAAGYLRGSWQRRRHRSVYRDRMEAYLATCECGGGA